MASDYLTTDFDTVNRDIVWNIPRNFGCPCTLIAKLQLFHTGMCTQVVMAGSQSSIFPVHVGVKQGCVLAPFILNLFLIAMTRVSHRVLKPSDGVELEHRIDGSLFNLRRLHAKAKASSALISALHYADNAALTSVTVDGHQRIHDVISDTPQCWPNGQCNEKIGPHCIVTRCLSFIH